MAKEKTLQELIEDLTWYNEVNKLKEILRRLFSGIGGKIETQDEGETINENTTILNFVGTDVTLTDQGQGLVEVEINSNGGGVTQDLQSTTDIGAITTNPMTVDLEGNTSGSALITTNDNGAQASLGISLDSGESVGSLYLKNENATGFSELIINKDSSTPNLFQLPVRPDATIRTLGIGVTDGSNTIYTTDNGIIDISSLTGLQDLQSVLNEGYFATGGAVGYTHEVDFNIDDGNFLLKTEWDGIAKGQFELNANTGPDSFKLFGSKAGSEEQGIRHNGNTVELFNDRGVSGSVVFKLSSTSNLNANLNTPNNLPTGTKYIPIDFTDGSTTVSSNSDGLVDLSTLSLGGDFIPLSGTEVGSPVTGDIEFESEGDFGIKEIANGVTNKITFEDGLLISTSDGVNYTEMSPSLTDGFLLNSDNAGSKGLSSTRYFGANYDDNTYVQKKYVDDEIAANSSSFDFYNESGSVVGEDAVALVGNLNPATFTGSGSFWQLSNPGGGVISTFGAMADNIQLANNPTSMVATSGLILSEAALGTALTGAVINIKGNILTDVPANSVNIEGLAVGIDTPFFGVGDIEEAGNGMQIGITDVSSLIVLGDINDVNNGTQLRISDNFERIELRAGSATNVYAMLETSNLSSSRLIEFQDKNIVVAGLEDIAKTPNSDAGTTIDNNNPLGREYNFTSANSNTEFTLTGTGGWASTLINAASEPTFTNETIEKLAGGTFIANTDIYLITRHTADGYQYWWSYKTITPDIDADTLESLTASQFLRSDVADIKTTGDLVLNNNIKLGLGTSSRNTLYSNGTDQLIIDLISDDYLAIKDNGTTRFSFGRTDGLFSTTNIVAESFKSEGTIATTNIIATIGDHSNGFRGTKVKVDDALRLAAMGDVDLQSNGLRIMINNTTGAFTIGDDTGVNGGTHIDIDDSNGEIDLNADTINVDGVVNLKSYTVATLPTGTEGDLAYITDGAAVPTWRATATGGGSLKILVFFDGTNWIYH